MIADPDTLYKLMILYILDLSEYPLNTAQLCEFLLDKGYTNYFTLQTTIADLVEAGFITGTHQGNSSFYAITASGLDALNAFKSSISEAIREDIKNFLDEKKYALRHSNDVTSLFLPKKDKEYEVMLNLKDNGEPLMNLTFNVASQSQAELVCDHWNKKYMEIYEYLLETLLSTEK